MVAFVCNNNVLKRVYSKRGEFAPEGSKSFPSRLGPFKNGCKNNSDKIAPYESVFIHLYPFKPSVLFYLNSLDRSISYIRGVWLVFIIIMCCGKF